MLLNIFKVGSEIAVLRSAAGKCLLTAIACVSVLAGCENLADMESGLRQTFNETFMSPDKSAIKKSVPAQRAAKEKRVTLNRRAMKRVQARLAKLGAEYKRRHPKSKI